MSPAQLRLTSLTVLLTLAGVGIALSVPPKAETQQQAVKTPAVETLLPADAMLYIGLDGRIAHADEFEETAAYEALYESGLAGTVSKIFDYVVNKIGPQAGLLRMIRPVYETMAENGLSVAVSVKVKAGPPQPWSILVLHNGAPLEPQLAGLLGAMMEGKAKFETRKMAGRTITRATLPNAGAQFQLEIGFWKEGKHLVFVLGVDAVSSALAVAQGQQANITTSRLWKKYRKGKEGFTIASAGWVDFGKLRSLFGGMPLPGTRTPDNPATVNDVFKVLGLHNAKALVFRTAYRGKATWGETVLEAPGPRSGLLALPGSQPITKKDLPPLPAQLEGGLYACRFHPAHVYATLQKILREGAKLGPPGMAAQVEGFLEQLPALTGIDLQKDLFDTLGDVFCSYSDPAQGPLGIGAAMLIRVKDSDKLQRTLNDVLQRAGKAVPPGGLRVKRQKKYGHTITLLDFGTSGFHLSYTVTPQWLCVAMYPQAVEAFLLRQQGALPSWQMENDREVQAGLAELPKSFSSVLIQKPRGMYRLMVGLMPFVFTIAKNAAENFGFDVSDLPVSLLDFPPAEVFTRPLFPNISVRTIDENGIRWTSRSSLPGLFGVDSVTVIAVGTALLLPAVQQAREAARRAESKNNLKQIGLALHNYHDTYGSFPYGTVQTPGRKPNERLSWMASILPFMDYPGLARRINFKKGWEDDANPKIAQRVIPSYQNPGAFDNKKSKYATTHYVGIAGVGADSLTTTKLNKKVGIFGYNRKTRMRDVTDGLSHTMMVSEASGNYGPWMAGGPATLRAFTKKPYVNGPDGIGGPYAGGFHVLMGDGSVRFLSTRTAPKVLEGLATMRGGERLPNGF